MVIAMTAEVQPTEPPRVQLTITGIGADTPLIENGGFEAGTDPWTPGDGVTLIVAPTSDADGQPVPADGPEPVAGVSYGYAHLDATAATAGQRVVFSQAATVPDGAQVAAVAYLAGTETIPATLRVTATTAGVPDTGTRTQDAVALSSAWQEYRPATLQLEEDHDGILVEVLVTPPAGEVARNWMLDPSAAGADPSTSWDPNRTMPTLDTTTGHTDTRSFLVPANETAGITVTTPADATRVTCSGWILAEAGTTYTLLLGGAAVQNTTSPTYTASGDWQYRSISTTVVDPGEDASFIAPRLASAQAWIDDIGITFGDTPVDFNGDTADEGIYTYGWDADPYASASVKSYADPLPVDVFADELAAIVPGDSGTLTVYRIVESTSSPVRGLLDITPTTSTMVAYDFAAPFGVPVLYQLVQVHTDGSTTTVTAGPVFLSSDGSWLSHPITGEGVEVTIVTWTELTYAARQNVVEVSGRPAPIVISDVHTSRSSDLVLYTDTREALFALRALLLDGDILQMRPKCDAVEPDYLAIGDIKETRVEEAGPRAGSNWARTITVSCQAVDQPAPAIPAIGDTLEDLHEYVPGTLADFPATFGEDATLLDIAQTPLTVT